MSRFINPAPEFKPSSKLYFYRAGTSTPITTYKDESETIANTHPVICSSDGYAPNIFFSGSARLVVQDSLGVQYLERDPVGGEKELGDFTLWDAQVIYDKNDIVEGSDGKFYQSFANSNQGNDPTTSASDWFEIRFLGVWNTNKTYVIGDVVQTSNGALWRSLVASNQGNDPSADDGTKWLPAIDSSKIPEIIKLTWQIKAIDFAAVTNEAYIIDGSGNTVDVTLPTIAAGDSFVFHNLITSTNKVQIKNPSYSINGSGGTIAAGTDVELAAGDSVQLVAKNTSNLEIVGAQA